MEQTKTLRPLSLHENKMDVLFNSENGQQLLSIYEEYYPKVGFFPPWIAYGIVQNGQLVGTCSFVSPPKNGCVEIAYWTFPEFEGQGIASFACSELLAIARKQDPSIQITAKTAPEKNASTQILEKNHFVFTEVVQDHEIGDAWLWKFKG